MQKLNSLPLIVYLPIKAQLVIFEQYQKMKSICLKICFLVVVVAISNCNGQNEKIFGFLRSAEKCTKESDPEACVKRNLDGWCENRKENLIDGTRVASVCDCIEGNPR